MKLHTRDQAREGQQPAQTPVAAWRPGRKDYLRFLVDSRAVYHCFEELVATHDELAPYRNSGLERTAALDADIAWFAEQVHRVLTETPCRSRDYLVNCHPCLLMQGLKTPEVGKYGTEYVKLLRELVAAGNWEAFTCHFYNYYFAHTAGGRMIGKQMADLLLDGRTLEFYKWGGVDPKEELLPNLRAKIDAEAEKWTREQKDRCLAETANTFRYGGSIVSYMREAHD